jgi:hypothetical protein
MVRRAADPDFATIRSTPVKAVARTIGMNDGVVALNTTRRGLRLL